MEKDKRRPVWDSADLIRDFDTSNENEESDNYLTTLRKKSSDEDSED